MDIERHEKGPWVAFQAERDAKEQIKAELKTKAKDYKEIGNVKTEQIEMLKRQCGDSSKAFSYLDKAVSYSSAISGKANLVRAQIMASNKKFSEAVSYCTKAAQEDVSISGSANRLKERILEVQRKNAEYERANAEYKAQKAAQEKEENFWKAGAGAN